jgi:pimeloyl-ACP methyl ester carboxylesterase
VALEYALRYPDRLSHLVLLDTGGDCHWAQQNAPDLLAERGHSAEQVELVRRWFNGEFEPREMFRIFMRIGGVYQHRNSPGKMARAMLSGAWRTKFRGETFVFSSRELVKGWTVIDRLGEITVPTLVIAGRDDFVFPPECQHELAAAIPGARLVIIDNAGHNPHLEQTAQVMATVSEFLSAAGLTE